MTAVMPSRLHDCVQDWFHDECLNMVGAGYLTIQQAKILKPNVGTGEMRAFQTFIVADLV